MQIKTLARACAVAVIFVSTLAPAADPAPVTLPRTFQYDLTAKVNGEAYRVVVGVPADYDRDKAYPAIFVLESNVYFATAVDALERQANFKVASPAIVVAVGYPSDDPKVGLVRRWYDLTPTPDAREKRRNGGGDEHLRFIEEEVKPLVYGKFKVDKERQVFWGHSNGGLLVMRAMFRNPESFTGYVISSPNIGWGESAVLKDEAAFIERMKQPGKPIFVMVTYGSKDYPRIMQLTPAFGERLAASGAARIKLHRQLFDDENHISVSHVALVTALRFALPPESKREANRD